MIIESQKDGWYKIKEIWRPMLVLIENHGPISIVCNWAWGSFSSECLFPEWWVWSSSRWQLFSIVQAFLNQLFNKNSIRGMLENSFIKLTISNKMYWFINILRLVAVCTLFVITVTEHYVEEDKTIRLAFCIHAYSIIWLYYCSVWI